MTMKRFPIEYAKVKNKVLYQPTKKNPNRDAFFRLYKTQPIDQLINRFVRVPNIFFRAIKKIIKTFINKS